MVRDKLIERVHDLAEKIEGYDFYVPMLKDMSNMELLDIYVEMRIEEELQKYEYRSIEDVDYQIDN